MRLPEKNAVDVGTPVTVFGQTPRSIHDASQFENVAKVYDASRFAENRSALAVGPVVIEANARRGLEAALAK